jgi:hypothetical protein
MPMSVCLSAKEICYSVHLNFLAAYYSLSFVFNFTDRPSTRRVQILSARVKCRFGSNLLVV